MKLARRAVTALASAAVPTSSASAGPSRLAFTQTVTSSTSAGRSSQRRTFTVSPTSCDYARFKPQKGEEGEKDFVYVPTTVEDHRAFLQSMIQHHDSLKAQRSSKKRTDVQSSISLKAQRSSKKRTDVQLPTNAGVEASSAAAAAATATADAATDSTLTPSQAAEATPESQSQTLSPSRPVPKPRSSISTPLDFLTAISSKRRPLHENEALLKTLGSDLQTLEAVDGYRLRGADVSVKDRRYVLWALEKYKSGENPWEFKISKKPRKVYRAWGPRVQGGARLRGELRRGEKPARNR